MKRYVLLCLTTVLAGCATHPVDLKDAKPVTADRIFAFKEGDQAATGKVIVVRDLGATGSLCPMAFYVDATLAAQLYRGEVVSLQVPAGDHILGAGPAGKGMCSWNNEAAHRRELSVTITASGTSKIRLGMNQGGVIEITPTAFGGGQ
ncbi:MAG: hypothetical protein DI597_20240 [Pseudoxanthomonas spadix]|nr:MAG: hypothetical protein DI597_20240 [Pseudoxanthomonas spadix]